MPKPKLTPEEHQKIIRAIMEWIIDDFATPDIISKIIVVWNKTAKEAKVLLDDARKEWASSTELQEHVLSKRIESLKKLKRSLKENYKGTPKGIEAMLAVENSIVNLESSLLTTKRQQEHKASLKKQRESLTMQQELFCREYVIDFNGCQAAIRAGYSKRTATEQASRLLRNVKVKNYIEDLLEEVRRNKAIDAEMALQELKELADWNIKDFVGEDWSLLDITTLSKRQTKPIVGIKSTKTVSKDGEEKTTTELKFVDKRAAWESVNRHFGNFEKDNRQRGDTIVFTRKKAKEVPGE